MVSAAAVAKTLNDLGIQDVEIKYINDLFLKQKKIAGIIVHGEHLAHDFQLIMIGIGVNLNTGRIEYEGKVPFASSV